VQALGEALEREHSCRRRFELRQEVDGGKEVARKCRAATGDVELVPVDRIEIERSGRGEDDERPAGDEPTRGLVCTSGGCEYGRVDLAPWRLDAGQREPVLARVEPVDTIAAAAQHLYEEVADEAAPNDEHAATGHALRRAQYAGERLGESGDGIVHRRRNVDPVPCERAFGEAAGLDRRRAELLARRLVSGAAALAFPAGEVVDEGHSAPVRQPAGDLVPEHGARSGRAELLDVAPAEAAGEDADDRAAPLRLRNLRELRPARFVESDRAHGSIVGRSRKEAAVAVKLYRCKNLWVKLPGHPCWRVQKALDEQGIEYEIVPGPWPSRGKREELLLVSGQEQYPVIQFEDGSVYREESKDMVATIKAGKLDEKRGTPRQPAA
jgi:hypothetical protein